MTTVVIDRGGILTLCVKFDADIGATRDTLFAVRYNDSHAGRLLCRHAYSRPWVLDVVADHIEAHELQGDQPEAWRHVLEDVGVAYNRTDIPRGETDMMTWCTWARRVSQSTMMEETS